MTDNLVGFRFIQTNAPEHGYAGYQWFNPNDGRLREWTGTNLYDNVGAGDWNDIYYGNQPQGGLLSLTGGAVTGAITGPAGWAAKDNYNFPTSLKVAGQNVATVSYVNQQVTSFNDLISAKISQAIAASTASINTNSNVAKANGYYDPTAGTVSGTIPPAFPAIQLPSYPNNGGIASETECVWIGAPGSLATTVATEAGTSAANYASWFQTFFYQESPRYYRHYVKKTSSGSGAPADAYTAGGMHWLIFGIKSSS